MLLSPESYEALRERAYKERRSVASLVREAVAAYVGAKPKRRRRWRIEDLTFLRSGRSRGPRDIARNHDKYLAEDFLA